MSRVSHHLTALLIILIPWINSQWQSVCSIVTQSQSGIHQTNEINVETVPWKNKHMGVSKNRGTPKWMVYNWKTLLKWMILGRKPTIFGNTHMEKQWKTDISNFRILVDLMAARLTELLNGSAVALALGVASRTGLLRVLGQAASWVYQHGKHPKTLLYFVFFPIYFMISCHHDFR